MLGFGINSTEPSGSAARVFSYTWNGRENDWQTGNKQLITLKNITLDLFTIPNMYTKYCFTCCL
jgi:hypothetical protein